MGVSRSASCSRMRDSAYRGKGGHCCGRLVWAECSPSSTPRASTVAISSSPWRSSPPPGSTQWRLATAAASHIPPAHLHGSPSWSSGGPALSVHRQSREKRHRHPWWSSPFGSTIATAHIKATSNTASVTRSLMKTATGGQNDKHI